MLISGPRVISNCELRRYYVGATRAKDRLFIHTDSTIFDRHPADEILIDKEQYGLPDEIILQLSHRDVNLGFFKSRKREILTLRSGQELRFENNFFWDPEKNLSVAQLSRMTQDELRQWGEKGYSVFSAIIRFVVAWRPKDAPKEEGEHAVLLIDLSLRKNL